MVMIAMNIHDANDMQSHKLGDAMFDEHLDTHPSQTGATR